MSLKHLSTVSVASVVALASSLNLGASAAGLVYNTQVTPNQYSYQLSPNITGTFEILPSGSQFILSGLSGVTGASVTGSSSSFFNTPTYTSTSVTFTSSTTFITSILASTLYLDFLVDSTVTTLGNVTSTGTNGFSRTVQGPVAAVVAVPEPSNVLGIASLGILGTVSTVLKKVSKKK